MAQDGRQGLQSDAAELGPFTAAEYVGGEAQFSVTEIRRTSSNSPKNGGFWPVAIEKADEVVLPEHQPLPVWKRSGSKREWFVAVYCEIRRRDDAEEGAASHGKREG